MTRAAPRAASVLFATLLFAAACGGGDELSEEEFVDQVNEICTEASNPVLDETLDILDEVEENPDMILSEEDPFANLATEMEELGLSECV